MAEIFSRVTGLTALIFISALITFNFTGFLQPVNPLINRAFPEAPNITCVNDSDCVLAMPSELSECRICDPYDCKNYPDSSPE